MWIGCVGELASDLLLRISVHRRNPPPPHSHYWGEATAACRTAAGARAPILPASCRFSFLVAATIAAPLSSDLSTSALNQRAPPTPTSTAEANPAQVNAALKSPTGSPADGL